MEATNPLSHTHTLPRPSPHTSTCARTPAQVEHTIEMTNTSPFELPFTCHLQQLNHRTLGGVRPFAVHPTEGVVAPGKKQKLTVTFRADHEPVFGITHMFTEDLRIVVPNQKEDLLVKLIARCWERGMYVVGGDEGPRLSDSFMAAESAAFVQRRSKTAENDDNHVRASSPVRPLCPRASCEPCDAPAVPVLQTPLQLLSLPHFVATPPLSARRSGVLTRGWGLVRVLVAAVDHTIS